MCERIASRSIAARLETAVQMTSAPQGPRGTRLEKAGSRHNPGPRSPSSELEGITFERDDTG